MIQKLQNWWFWYRQARIKQKNAPHKFKRRSEAAKLGWQTRREQIEKSM